MKTKDNDESDERGFHLTDKQKKIAIAGAVAVGAALAAYGVYKLADIRKPEIDVGELQSGTSDLDAISEAIGITRDSSFSVTEETLSSAMKNVCPYSRGERGGNCGPTATSVLFNWLGFKTHGVSERDIPDILKGKTHGTDMRALLREGYGLGEERIESLRNTDVGRVAASSAINSGLESYGEGAFGYIWYQRPVKERNTDGRWVPTIDENTGLPKREGHTTAWRVLDGVVRIGEGQVPGGRVDANIAANSMNTFLPDSVSWVHLGNHQSFAEDVIVNPDVIGSLLRGER